MVEDNADLRTMIINMLLSLGYGVLESGTAKSAVEVLQENPQVTLLVTDVVLPGGMSGRELADQVQEKYPNLPVLYMSGYTQDAIIHHGRLDHGVQLLEKPFLSLKSLFVEEAAKPQISQLGLAEHHDPDVADGVDTDAVRGLELSRSASRRAPQDGEGGRGHGILDRVAGKRGGDDRGECGHQGG